MELFQEFRKQKVLDQIPSGPLVVGVSGGADSVTLLHLLWRLRKERAWNIVVAHVQHHLRGEESLRDQHFVKRLCKSLKINCEVRSCNVKEFRLKNRKKRWGIEEAARILRYQTFSKIAQAVKAKSILTAHSANDQVETFFLNLIRGTGPQGLCGIWPVRPSGDLGEVENRVSKSLCKLITRSRLRSQLERGRRAERLFETLFSTSPKSPLLVIRPLLAFSRDEILIYLKSQKLSYCEDSSNQNTDFKRNWVRRELLPLLKKVQPKIYERVSNLTQLLQNSSEGQDIQLQDLKRKVLLVDGRWLDLEAFFKYHLYLRTMFLHEIFPHASSRFIHKKMADLEKEIGTHHRRVFPVAKLNQ